MILSPFFWVLAVNVDNPREECRPPLLKNPPCPVLSLDDRHHHIPKGTGGENLVRAIASA